MPQLDIKQLEFSTIVVGSGAAGCAAARAAADAGAEVLLLSKDPLTASDTKIAEGIVTVRASGDDSDTESVLSLNMRIQGDDLADASLTDAFARDSDKAYEWLVNEGLLSSLSEHDGRATVLPMALGGHDRKRSVEHANGALDYAHALWNSVQRQGGITQQQGGVTQQQGGVTAKQGGITIMEDVWAIDLITTSHANEEAKLSRATKLEGLLAYHAANGQFLQISAKSVVLACGGASTLYFPCTDTMRGNSGDAYGMALRAGVPLIDMEQVQFLPFGIAAPRAFEGILAGEPVSCGPLGVLRDANGEIILSELMVRTRAECASAIATAVADGRGTENGGCWLDLSANVEGQSGALFLRLMRAKAGAILANIKKAMGQKAARFEQWWEVRPTAHYFMGGVVADAHGATQLAGLFVAGQAMGGLHGSNRLGSTSLAEGAIFGRRAGLAAAHHAMAQTSPHADLSTQTEQMIEQLVKQPKSETSNSVISIQTALQRAAYIGIGPARSGNSLNNFANLIDKLEQDLMSASKVGSKIWNQTLLDYLDTRNMLMSAKAIAVSAKARSKSLGAHVRIDHSNAKPLKRKSITVHLNQEQQVITATIARASSPKLQTYNFKLKELGRLLRLKLLRRLPLSVRDKLLSKMYAQMLNPEQRRNEVVQAKP